MAISTSTLTGDLDGSTRLFTWTLTTADPAGDAVEWPQWVDRTFQSVGTWGGATLTFQGSNNGTDWFTMKKADGGAVATHSANDGTTVIDSPRYARPNLTTPGTGATVVVTMHARRANPMRT